VTVNNEFERMQKVKVVQLTWNLPRRNKKDVKDLKIFGVPGGIRTGN